MSVTCLSPGPLHRKHRHDGVAFPGGIQEQLFRRRIAEPMAGPTPPELVKAHLKLDPQAMAASHKEKYPVVPA